MGSLAIGNKVKGRVVLAPPRTPLVNLGKERFGTLNLRHDHVSGLVEGDFVSAEVVGGSVSQYPEVVDLKLLDVTSRAKAISYDVATALRRKTFEAEFINFDHSQGTSFIYEGKYSGLYEVPRALIHGSFMKTYDGGFVRLIKSGYVNPVSGREVCCTEEFILQATEILNSIKTGRVFTSDNASKKGKGKVGFLSQNVMGVRDVRESLCDMYLLAGKEQMVEFMVTARGYKDDWTVIDLLKSMAEFPLVAEEIGGMEEAYLNEEIPAARVVKKGRRLEENHRVRTEILDGERRGLFSTELVSGRAMRALYFNGSIGAIDTGIMHPTLNLPIYCSADFVYVAKRILNAIKNNDFFAARRKQRFVTGDEWDIFLVSTFPLTLDYQPTIYWRRMKTSELGDIRQLEKDGRLEFSLNADGMEYDPVTGLWGFIKAMATHPLGGEVNVAPPKKDPKGMGGMLRASFHDRF